MLLGIPDPRNRYYYKSYECFDIVGSRRGILEFALPQIDAEGSRAQGNSNKCGQANRAAAKRHHSSQI